MRARGVLLVLLLSGCGSDVVTCAGDARCVRAGVHGSCVQSTVSTAHFCAFADGACPTGQRWDKTAGDGLGKQCVGSIVAPPDMAPAAPQPNGAACTAASECTSGFCVDGYCCDRDCSGEACAACNVPGNLGTCTPIANGSPPAATHPSCGPDDKSTCARDGMCDGKGACRKWANGTICGTSACDSNSNMFTPAHVCDGNGTCVPSQAITCAPYLCKDAQSCFSSCTMTTGQCSGTNSCDANGSCGPKVNGTGCSKGNECASGYCVDGVCCNSDCTGQCQACDLAGSKGMCATVMSGQPHGSRPACGGTEVSGNGCAGQCDGSSPAKCGHPTSQCRAQSCENQTTEILADNCNGAGYCPSARTMSCGAFVCKGSSCLTSCSTEADCSGSIGRAAYDWAYYCQAGQCYPVKSVGSACSSGVECRLNAACVHCCSSTTHTCTNDNSCGIPPAC